MADNSIVAKLTILDVYGGPGYVSELKQKLFPEETFQKRNCNTSQKNFITTIRLKTNKK